MQTILVTASESGWKEAQEHGEFTYSTITSSLQDVGFIHATFPDQVIDMLNRHFTGRDDVVLLLVDAEKVNAPVKYEAALSGRPGTFPHIYGPLNLNAVYATVTPEKKNGLYIPPKGLESTDD